MYDLKHVIDAISHPTVLIDETGRVTFVNADAEAILSEGLVHQHYITALRQPALLDAVEDCLQHGAQSTTRFLGRDMTKETVYLVHTKSMVRGNSYAALLTFEDISAAEEMAQLRRDFVANVSHELKTPLTAITGLIETLQGPAKGDPKTTDRFLTIMAVEAARMDHLIRDLLSLSQVQAEARVMPKDTVQISDILQAVRQRYVEGQGHVVTIENASVEASVQGDMAQLIQVFSNLIENALKYGDATGVRIAVQTTDFEPKLRSAGVRVDVMDHGDGIDAVHLPRLTERFYRIDTHRARQMGGIGLGLSIVKHILNRHRGRLEVASVKGQGSTFTVILPIVEH